MLICLPRPDVLPLMGELPAGVEPYFWNGEGTPPAGADQVEILVAPYGVPATPADFFAGLPGLKVVQLLSAGVDAWLKVLPEGVTLCRGAGVHSASTADLALTLALSSLRQIPAFVRSQDQRSWQPLPGTTLSSKRVLIVGAGDIGHAIARRVAAFDARVTLVARTARDGVHAISELPRLLPDNDVIVLVVPLTDETQGLVDAPFLAALPDGALLVNVARGAVVQTGALVAELRSGRLHAALDVTDPEPLPADHPLWSTPNTLITPHVGGGAEGWVERGYALVGDQIRRYVAGEPLQYVVTGSY